MEITIGTVLSLFTFGFWWDLMWEALGLAWDFFTAWEFLVALFFFTLLKFYKKAPEVIEVCVSIWPTSV